MKTTLALSVAVIFFIFSSCCKKTTATKESQANASLVTAPVESKQDTGSTDTYRFVVSFYSSGEGTEGDQISRLEKFISDYGIQIKKEISFEKTQWGREGEVNYCLKLSGFSPADQLHFMDEAKNILKSAKRVRFSENAVCRQGRNRK